MSRPLKGILLTCVAVLAFAALDSLSKYLATFNSVLMIRWVRYLAQTCLLAACLPSMRLLDKLDRLLGLTPR